MDHDRGVPLGAEAVSIGILEMRLQISFELQRKIENCFVVK